MSKSDSRRLNSWKEIAAYFGNDQRTVKRWEQTRGLPVRRLPGARSGVFALASDLEAWQRGETVVLPATDEAAEAAASEPLPPAIPLGSDTPGPTLEELPDELILVEEPTLAAPGSAAGKRRGRTRALWVGAVAALLLVGAMAVGLRGRQRTAHAAAAAGRHVPQAQARELYLDGRFRWNKRTPEDLKAALADFEQASRLDPAYAAAYAGIADCYALEPQFAGRHGEAVFSRMLEMANRAVALDSSLPEAHRALGFAYFYWNWDRAASRREFERAIALDGRDPTTHLWFANTLMSSGTYDEALREIDRARELDPASVAIKVDRGWILYCAGRHAEAEAIWQAIEQTDPGYRMAHFWNAVAALDEHRPQQYVDELRTLAASGDPADRERLAAAEGGLRRGGEREMLEAAADAERKLYAQHRTAAFTTAQFLTRASHADEALDYLDLALAERDDSVVSLAVPGCLAPLAGTPRYRGMLARVMQPHEAT